jgi:steroid 5-alpha reductase family enzyme
MLILLSESFFIGFICFVIGTIIFNFTIDKTKENNEQKTQKSRMIGIIFFITGVILHIILDLGGFNKWYCNKKTICGYNNLALIK